MFEHGERCIVLGLFGTFEDVTTHLDEKRWGERVRIEHDQMHDASFQKKGGRVGKVWMMDTRFFFAWCTEKKRWTSRSGVASEKVGYDKK